MSQFLLQKKLMPRASPEKVASCITELRAQGNHVMVFELGLKYLRDSSMQGLGLDVLFELSISAFYVLSEFDRSSFGTLLIDYLMFHTLLSPSKKKLCSENLFHYIPSLHQLVNNENVRQQQLFTRFTPRDEPYTFFINPSLCLTSATSGCLLLREINYAHDIVSDSYRYNDYVRTHSHIYDLNAALESPDNTIDGDRAIIETDLDSTKLHDGGIVKGHEDVRLLTDEHGHMYGLCTSQMYNSRYMNEMILLQLIQDDNGITKVVKAVRLHPEWETEENKRYEKNWVPFVQDGRLYFIYSHQPFIILSIDFSAFHDAQTGDIISCIKMIQTSDELSKTLDMSHLRGSSQAIKVQYKQSDGVLTTGFLYIVHQVTFFPHRRYYHRFMLLNAQSLQLCKLSPPFYLLEKTVEFVAGLCRSPQHSEELIISMGFEDRQSHLFHLQEDSILSSLQEIASVMCCSVAATLFQDYQ